MDTNIAWAAGLLEGEACFDIRTSSALKRDPRNKQVRVIVEMKDEDVLQRLKNIFGGSVKEVTCKSKIKEGWAIYYKWLLSDRASIYKCLIQIKPFMSKRRNERIEELIEFLERKLNEDC